MRARLVMAMAWVVGCSAELKTPETMEPTPSNPGTIDPVGPAAPLRLLTRAEYDRTIRDLIGPIQDPSEGLPAENQALGFDNISSSHQASSSHVNAYQAAAVRLAVGTSSQVNCTGPRDSTCARTFIETFGRRAFRRPLTQSERGLFQDLYDAMLPELGFDGAIEAVVQAFLQSPQFLYRVEFDGDLRGDRVRLDGWVLASRLSYLLWASMPDDALLDAAERGDLDTPQGLEAQARRMLQDPRARDGAMNFYRQVLGSQGFGSLMKDQGVHPDYEPGVALELERSLHAFMDFVIFEAGLGALFDSDRIYASQRLAELYGLPSPQSEFGPVRADRSRRRGLLTQPALMSLLAKPDGSAPILRGVFVLDRIFCRAPPPPPPDVPTVAPDPDPDATTRERFAQHTEDEACASCHQYIDPVGFAFENYDGLGRWRDTENGRPVDASGAITLTDDPELAGPVANAVEMSQRLVSAREVPHCIARQWFRYGLGRGETESDVGTIERLGEVLADTGDFEEMLVAFVRSEPFRTRGVLAEDGNR